MFVLFAFLASAAQYDLSHGDISISEHSKTEWQVTQNNKNELVPKSTDIDITGRASNTVNFDCASDSVLRLNLNGLQVNDASFAFLNLNGFAKIQTKSKTTDTAPGVFSLDNENIVELLANETSLSETPAPTPTETDEGISKTAVGLAVALPLCVIIAFIIGFILGLWCSRRHIIYQNEPLEIHDHYQRPLNDRPIFQEFRR